MDQIGAMPEPVLPILPGGTLVVPIPVGKDAAADALLLSGQGVVPDRTGNRTVPPAENSPGTPSAPSSGESGEPLPDPAYTLLLGDGEPAFLPLDAEGRPRPVSSYDSFGRSTIKSGGQASAAAGSRSEAVLLSSRALPGDAEEIETLLPEEQLLLLSLTEDEAPSLPRQTNPLPASEAGPRETGGELPQSDAFRSPVLPGSSAPGASETGTAHPVPADSQEIAASNAAVPAGSGTAAPGTLPDSPGKAGAPASPAPAGSEQSPDVPAGAADGTATPAKAVLAAVTVTLPAAEKLPARPTEGVPDPISEALEELAGRPASGGAAEAERTLPRTFSGALAASPFRGETHLPYAFAPFGDVSHSLRRLLGEEEEPLPIPAEGERAPGAHADAIRLSETVRMACLLHSLYTGSDVRFEIEVPWYGAYVRYAVRNGILRRDQFPDYNAFATRAEAVDLFSRCVPAAALPPLRSCPLPSDVQATDWFAEGAARLLRAGVLDCPDRQNRFFPGRLLTRSEAATLLGRIATPSDRRRSGC